LKNRIKVQLETEQRREWKKTLRCRELLTVEVGFMVGGKNRRHAPQNSLSETSESQHDSNQNWTNPAPSLKPDK